VTRAYRAEIAWPRDLEQEDQHFHSGINDKGEVRGLLMSGQNLGITANNMRPGMLRELSICRYGFTRLFVDSGAFSEVSRTNVFKVVKPITHESWRERFRVYRWAAATLRRRAYLVAPDRVANQEVTLERMMTYALDIAFCAGFGAHIIIPVQKGSTPMGRFFTQAKAILGVRDDQAVAGIPMMKDATSPEELREFAETLPWFGAKVHLLGIGPRAKNNRFRIAIDAIRSVRPNCEITSDSALVKGVVGRGGTKAKEREARTGKKTKPRQLTALQDEARAMGMRGSVVKQYGAGKLTRQRVEEQLARAAAQGWRDTELDDDDEDGNANVGELAEANIQVIGQLAPARPLELKPETRDGTVAIYRICI
jgi:hypothetical protein